MLIHAVCSAFLLTCAKLYWLMDNEYLNYFAGLLAPERDRHFRVGCWARSMGYNSSLTDYGRMFAFRKVLEIATQVPNGYLYSTLLARSWINHAKVSILIVNCWYSFIHLMLLRNDPDSKPAVTPHRISVRFAALIVDAILATTTAIILPSAIILPYALQFDFKNLDFPDSMLYGDAAFPNLVLENRAFFFMSWANSMMKICFSMSRNYCFHTPHPIQT
ncbi:hypothetical protein PHMEG_00029522 [Phytophthora megakarya]|uniref:Transmembrane protein n=1 Tax=Phytophthora megakarya TaxID=4795 RepID=A0A225V3E8_9STRA|nr:hypothetical protein PHMEG_00029522 [Phytophthora megakarya]